VGANPIRQPLQPEAIGAVMEVTKWLKPFDYPKRDRIQRTQGVVVASVPRTGWIEGRPSPYLG
jgi:hypothetical protein